MKHVLLPLAIMLFISLSVSSQRVDTFRVKKPVVADSAILIPAPQYYPYMYNQPFGSSIAISETYSIVDTTHMKVTLEKAGIQPYSYYDSTDIYLTPDALPAYPGGNTAMYAYINRNLNKIPGCTSSYVTVHFIVERDGSLSGLYLDEKANKVSCHPEAVRIIRQMPRWQPAMHNGKAVRAKQQVLIPFNPA